MTPNFNKLYETLGYGAGFPTVHKVSKFDTPTLRGKPSKWQIAWPGGMDYIKWFTADNKDPELRPQKTQQGTLVAHGKTDSGKRFKMEFEKEEQAEKLCPYDPETWKPVNIKGGTGKSAGSIIEGVVNEALADIVKDNGEYVFISPSGKEVLRVSDLSRAQDWKMHYMRKKRWKFKGRADADF
jgi:hypothetical protein